MTGPWDPYHYPWSGMVAKTPQRGLRVLWAVECRGLGGSVGFLGGFGGLRAGFGGVRGGCGAGYGCWWFWRLVLDAVDLTGGLPSARSGRGLVYGGARGGWSSVGLLRMLVWCSSVVGRCLWWGCRLLGGRGLVGCV